MEISIAPTRNKLIGGAIECLLIQDFSACLSPAQVGEISKPPFSKKSDSRAKSI
jgi:hypothetical protein